MAFHRERCSVLSAMLARMMSCFMRRTRRPDVLDPRSMRRTFWTRSARQRQFSFEGSLPLFVPRICAHVREEHGAHVNVRTMHHVLVRNGFVFGTGSGFPVAKEDEGIVSSRAKYSMERLANRLGCCPKRPEVWLNESYVNMHHVRQKTWFESVGAATMRKRAGKGP